MAKENAIPHLPNNLLLRKQYMEVAVPLIGKDIIKIFTGQRRVGKSFMMYQIVGHIIKHQPKANIQFVNMELPEFASIRSDGELLHYLKDKTKAGQANFLFIDEVQEIEHFEKALRSLLTGGKWDIWCTGSNASLLSGDIAGKLSGRTIQIPVHTLSYQEFLTFHRMENDDAALQRYMRYGGLPYLIHMPMNDLSVFGYLRGIYDSILYRDIVVRFRIRNTRFLESLVLFAADNTGSLISAKSISDYLKSQKINMPGNLVLEYLKYLADAYLLHRMGRSDLQGKKIFEFGEKYYFNDLGLRHAVGGFKPNDINKVIENVIMLHLKIHGYTIHTAYEKNREIDFVCEKNGQKLYIQACYQMSNTKVFEREFGNLLLVKDNFPKYVVSMDATQFDSYQGIQHVRLRDFLTMSPFSL